MRHTMAAWRRVVFGEMALDGEIQVQQAARRRQRTHTRAALQGWHNLASVRAVGRRWHERLVATHRRRRVRYELVQWRQVAARTRQHVRLVSRRLQQRRTHVQWATFSAWRSAAVRGTMHGVAAGRVTALLQRSVLTHALARWEALTAARAQYRDIDRKVTRRHLHHVQLAALRRWRQAVWDVARLRTLSTRAALWAKDRLLLAAVAAWSSLWAQRKRQHVAAVSDSARDSERQRAGEGGGVGFRSPPCLLVWCVYVGSLAGTLWHNSLAQTHRWASIGRWWHGVSWVGCEARGASGCT